MIVRNAEVNLVARSTNPYIADMYQSPGALSVDHIWLSWEPIRLHACSGENARWNVTNMVKGDLATGIWQPFTVEEREYCAVASSFVGAEHPLPSDAPIEMRGRGLFIEGRLANGAPFVLASELFPMIRLQSGTAIPFHTDPVRLLVSFDLAVAFNGLDLSTAVPDSEGVIRLENQYNWELLGEFEKRMPLAFSLHIDVDGDFRIGPYDQPISQAQ